MFKKSDIEGLFELIKETKKDGSGFKGFIQGFKELGNINVKSSNIIEFSEKISSVIDRFNSRSNNQTFNLNNFLKYIEEDFGSDIADKFKAIAEGSDNATASLKDMFAVAIDGNTHGLKNVTGLINEFNKLDGDNQKDFAAAIGESNVALGNYLGNVKDGTASLGGYAGQLAATTAKTIGLQLATVALNMGITAFVNLAIWGITKLVNRQKELKESTDELISSFKSVKEEANSLSKNSDELASEYSKLSKGVDGLGNNVALTAEEYERYKEITNQIAEDIPSLIKGYDDEGNAILDLKGNVDELKQAYIDARKEKYLLMLTDENTDDAVKHFKEMNGGSQSGAYKNFSVMGGATISVSVVQAIETAKKALSKSYDELKSEFEDSSLDTISSLYLPTFGFNKDMTQEEFEEYYIALKTELTKIQAEYNQGLSAIHNIADSYLYSSDDYDKLDDNMKKFASILSNNIPDDVLKGVKTQEDVGKYVNDILDKLTSASPEIQQAYNSLVNFEISDKPLSVAKSEIDKYVDILADYLGTDENQLKLSLGIDNIDEDYNDLKRVLAGIQDGIGVNWLPTIEDEGINTREEIELFKECLGEVPQSTEQVVKALELYAEKSQEQAAQTSTSIRSLEELQEAYDGLSDSASNYSKNQKTLASAFEEQEKYGQLSASTIQELVEAGYAQALVTDKETSKVTLNVNAYNRLNKAKKESLILEAEQQKSELKEKFKDEEKAISDLVAEMQYANAERRTAITLEMQQHGLTMSDIAEEMSKIDGMVASMNAPEFDTGSGDSSKPQQVIDYEKWVAQQEHEIAMGKIKEDETYYSEKLRRAEEAYKGLTEYEQDLWKVQEEVYNGRKKLAEEAFDNEHDLFKQRVDDLEQIANEISETSIDTDGTKLNTQEKYREIASAYEEIRYAIEDEINRIVQAGVEGHENLLDELNKQLEEYTDKINETFKSAVEAEKSLLEKAKEAKSSEYDEQIDKVKSQQEAAQKAADAEIEAIQTKIDNLQKVNDEKQREYDIEKAKQDLEKAGQRTRRVYGSDGSIEYMADPDAINEAQKNLDDLLLEKQIDSLENQKSVLEEMRDKESASYDTMIADIESQKEQDERQFDSLLQYLDGYLNPTGDTSNADVWSEIAKIEGATFESGKWYDKDGNVIDIDGLYSVLEKDKEEKTTPDVSDSKVTNEPSKLSGNAELIEKLLTKMGANPDVIKSITDNFSKNRPDPSLYNIMLNSTQQPTQDALRQFDGQYRINPNSYEVANKSTNEAYTINGDIVINNPVGNADDLARNLFMRFSNAIERKSYSNIKKY